MCSMSGVDSSAPGAPVIHTMASDNQVNAAEQTVRRARPVATPAEAGQARAVPIVRRGAPAQPAGEEAEFLLFSASAPLSADYALGLKVGD